MNIFCVSLRPLQIGDTRQSPKSTKYEFEYDKASRKQMNFKKRSTNYWRKNEQLEQQIGFFGKRKQRYLRRLKQGQR